jgi:lysophospholipase L1-like esterase
MALAACGLLVSLGVAEIGLRLGRFEFHLMPSVQFGWPDPKTLHAQYWDDPDLFWVPKGYQGAIAEARDSHPDIVFMGDSCTEFGQYPRFTLARLIDEHAAVSTGLRVGTGGWSSEQGVAQLERDIVPLHPKIVTIFFGWNDHWVALGPTDPELRSAHRFLWLADHLRLAQAALKARFGASAKMTERPNRVPAERYRANLERLVDESRGAGIVPVLITAPSNHVTGQEPANLAERHLRSLAELVPLHRQYQAITREVARARGAALCDLAADFDGLPAPHSLYFMADGIHFSAEGDRAAASFIAPCIVRAAASR